MYLQQIKLKNFKCFSDNTVELCVPDGEIEGSGLNILVGENNSGKTSFMEAFHFIRNKSKSNIKKIGTDAEEEFYVEQVFTGNIQQAIEDFIQTNKKRTFSERIEENESTQRFTVRREFQDDESMKKILIYEPSSDSFGNPSGIDAPFGKFYQISNIWADTNPDNESKYGASTICGNLLADISEKFKIENAPQIEEFIRVFNQTFNDEESGLQADLNEVAIETEVILNEQFGEANLKFRFDAPEPTVHFKNIKILVKDDEETEISEKGHGMQRAVILSLLQVYARRITQIQDGADEVKLKPHFLFIDEPEMGLHPQAQKKLYQALKVIAKNSQVFISTHSESFISADLINNIFRFTKTENSINITSGKRLDIDLRVNRKFFQHHHQLFFTKRCIFVEGADDYERYKLFCKNNGYSSLEKDFYFLAGCSDYKVFRDLCQHFGIVHYFIGDVDLMSTSNRALKNISRDIWDLVLRLNKQVSKKTPTNILDANLGEEEIAIKNNIRDNFFDLNIFILSDGAVEHYLDNDGLSSDENKHDELIGIFSQIQSEININRGIISAQSNLS